VANSKIEIGPLRRGQITIPALTGLISDGTNGTVAVGMTLFNASGSYITEINTAVTPNASYAIYGRSDLNPSNVNVVYGVPYIRMDFASGITCSFSIRIYVPTFRRVS
jgi:hypothetical protein